MYYENKKTHAIYVAKMQTLYFKNIFKIHNNFLIDGNKNTGL